MGLMMVVGCDGHYRYPCQDPNNWDKAECNNEVCKAEGECTADVLGSTQTVENIGFVEQNLDEGFDEYMTQDDCTGE